MTSRKKFGKLDMRRKIDILSRLDAGELPTDLAHEHGVTKSAISYIKRKRISLLDYAASLETTNGNLLKKTMSNAKDNKLEDAVYTWFRQNRLLGDPMSGPIICEKALIMNEKLGGSSNFKASTGWLTRFKQRHGIREISIDGEKLSSDMNSAVVFRDEFRKRFEEGCYKPENIYNADEAGLHWKTLPPNTLVSRLETVAPGEKVKKDRVTAMVCVNATGDHRLPILVIGKYENSRYFKDTTCLPVTYRTQNNGWMNRDIFTDWYVNQFIPIVKKKQAITREGGKVILLLDNAPFRPSPESLNMIDDNFEVIYFPPQVTTIMQPMDQGIIEKLKLMYRRNLLTDLLIGETTSVEYFEKMTLEDCIMMLADAWTLLTEANLKNAWKKLMPKLENYKYDDYEYGDDIIISDLVALLHNIPGCGDCDEDGTRAWINEDRADPGWEILNDDAIAAMVREKDINVKIEDSLDLEYVEEPLDSDDRLVLNESLNLEDSTKLKEPLNLKDPLALDDQLKPKDPLNLKDPLNVRDPLALDDQLDLKKDPLALDDQLDLKKDPLDIEDNESVPSAREALAAIIILRKWLQNHTKCRVEHLICLDELQSLATNSILKASSHRDPTPN